MGKIYILFGKYSDGSGVKIPRAYKDIETAEKDLNLIHECDPCSDLYWEIMEVPVYGSEPSKPVMR